MTVQSGVKAAALTIGTSNTDTNNFQLRSNADGTATLARKSDGSGGDVLTIDGSGNVNLPVSVLQGGIAMPRMVLSTTKATTSGTSIDFTSIPSWVKKITVMFNAVSTNGTSNYLVRIGNTTFTATGYVSTMTYVNIGANSCTGDTDTTGFRLTKDTTAAVSFSGVMLICLLSNYVYVAGFNGIGEGERTFQGGGVLNLGSVLDRVSLTTVNGTDAFDAGSVNIMYEG